MTPEKATSHVFRDPIEENREGYSLVYHPADVRSGLAVLNLTFTDQSIESAGIRKAMEKELEKWLKRFPVPVKVSAMDEKRVLIRLSPNSSDWHLMGYVRLWDSAIVRRWAMLGEQELPSDQKRATYLARAYETIPFRVCEEVRVAIRRKRRETTRAGASAAIFLVGGLGLIWAVLAGGNWVPISLGLILTAKGAYEISRLFGWRQPSQREEQRLERRKLLERYFYHCEKNREKFLRLVDGNLDREIAEERRKEKERVRQPGRRPNGESRWRKVRWLIPFRGRMGM